MTLDRITPVILTLNEESNIARVLERLAWAKDVVVVDSFSTDRTVELARRFANVRLFQRAFDSHDRQWSYALRETGIETPWVLTLDADYLVSDAFTRELAALDPAPEVAGYEAQFRFCIHGRPLRRSLYPGRIVLFRRACGSFYQDGHTQRIQVEGAVAPLCERLDLDDRKPVSQWVAAQDRYARLERHKLVLAGHDRLGFADRLRTRRFLSPLVVLIYCLFAKRMILEGLPGWYYTYQRVTFEILLSLYLIEERFSAASDAREAAASAASERDPRPSSAR
jgi:glycosyltransferase involved in cell wall biosynthesis